MTDEELKPQEYLSPSSINSYLRCPRCYFYNYIAKLEQPPSIHLTKGNIVHKTLEDFFKAYKKDLKTHYFELYEKTKKSYSIELKKLELPEDQLEHEMRDMDNIMNEYWIDISRKIKNLIE